MLKTHRKQNGTAIILALFVTAIAASIAVAMVIRLRSDIHRTHLLLNHIQINLYADAAQFWAISTLANNWQSQTPNKLIDKMPIKSPTDKINGATIITEISDMQSKLNLNNLVNPTFQPIFERLIQQVDPQISIESTKEITQGIVNWISPSIENNNFDKFYAKKSPPYMAPHQPMQSISELRMIKGVNSDLFKLLTPFIAALPASGSKININTTPLQLLLALSPALPLDKAQEFIQQRKTNPITSTNQLKKLQLVLSDKKKETMLDVSSQYFLVKATVNMSQQQEITYSLLYRDQQNPRPNMDCIWQSKETL